MTGNSNFQHRENEFWHCKKLNQRKIKSEFGVRRLDFAVGHIFSFY
jgi:hypothetical protein